MVFWVWGRWWHRHTEAGHGNQGRGLPGGEGSRRRGYGGPARPRGAGSWRERVGVRRPHRRAVPPRGPDKRKRAVRFVAGFWRHSPAPPYGGPRLAGGPR